MYKKYSGKLGVPAAYIHKVLLIMRLSTVILIASLMQVSAATLAQKVTLSEKKTSLKEIFKELRKQTNYDFVCTDELFQSAKTVNIKVKAVELKDVLDQIFRDQPLTYTIDEKTVVIKEKERTFIEKVKDFFSTIEVHGRVLDEQGKPIPGATVQTKDHKQASVTDANGEFRLKKVEAGVVLVISFIGYQPKDVAAAAEMGNIRLEVATSKLDEVQVIAYGETSRRLSISNIGSVKAADIEKQPVTNPLLALQGRVPGLVITQATGYANASVTVRIQGQNSIANGNDPLYVIDGVPYISQLPNSGGGFSAVLGPTNSQRAGDQTTLGGGNPLSFINPNDIESIDVLKDADATAIYGSRAGNGAILITTKKGKAGATKVDATVQNGWGQVGHFLPLMNTQQYLEMRREAFKNDGLAVPDHTTAPIPSNYDLTIWDQNRSTDWQKVLIGGTAQYTNVQATISGGSGNTNFLVGAGYNHQTTVFPGNLGDTKGSMHFNINHASANQKFKIQFTSSYMVDVDRILQFDLTAVAERMPPNAPALYNADGSLNWAPLLNPDGTPKLDFQGRTTSTWSNPLAFLNSTYRNKTNNLVANAVMSYELLPGLVVKSNFGYTNMQIDGLLETPSSAYAPEQKGTYAGMPLSYFSTANANSWIVEPQILYKRRIGEGILDILAGATIQQSNSNGQGIRATGFSSDQLLANMGAASTLTSDYSNASIYRYNALFARAGYNWEGKYLINLTARRDGSSRFGADNEFHSFGSVGVAWIFSNEPFVKDNLPFLSFGKLRGSYGTTGNDQIGDYHFLNQYNSLSSGAVPVYTPYQGVDGLTPGGLPNPHLAWETINKLQGGLDIGFFRDRFLLNVSYFRNRSSNQLLNYNLPQLTGYSSVLSNFPATIQNSGWEFSLNSINVQNRNFRWSSNFNLTAGRNKLIAFPNLANSSSFDALFIGEPITVGRYFRSLGVDPATGLYIEQGANGPTSSPQVATDRTLHIDLTPKITGGFQNSFSYKGLQLDVLLQFAKQKKQDYRMGYQPGQFASNIAFIGGNVTGNQPVWVLQRWQKPGDVASIQKFSNYLNPFTGPGFQAYLANIWAAGSDAPLGDASYIRLKNVSLSWSLPQAFQQHLHLQNARIFAQGQNLLTFTHYKGMDPENGSSNSLPPLRIMTLGLQIGL